MDAYQTDVHQTAEPFGHEMERRSSLLEGVCASVTFDSKGGIVTVCVGVEGPKLVLVDARTLAPLATMRLTVRRLRRGRLRARLSGPDAALVARVDFKRGRRRVARDSQPPFVRRIRRGCGRLRAVVTMRDGHALLVRPSRRLPRLRARHAASE